MAKVLLKNVRMVFDSLYHVAKPIPGSTSPPKHEANFIMATDSDAFKVAQSEFVAVAMEKFGANALAILAELAKDKKCIRRGNSQLDKKGVVREGFADMMFIVAKNKDKPIVVDRMRQPALEQDGLLYGGCIVNCTVDIYAHEKDGLGKRVDATLLAVQFVADAPRLGTSVGSAGDFDELDEPGTLPDPKVAAAIDEADLF
jgi:hypothetical protein